MKMGQGELAEEIWADESREGLCMHYSKLRVKVIGVDKMTVETDGGRQGREKADNCKAE